jgi:hypothetical protein
VLGRGDGLGEPDTGRVELELSVIDLRAAPSVELAVAELERVKNAEQAPDVLVSALLRRDRFTPPHSG